MRSCAPATARETISSSSRCSPTSSSRTSSPRFSGFGPALPIPLEATMLNLERLTVRQDHRAQADRMAFGAVLLVDQDLTVDHPQERPLALWRQGARHRIALSLVFAPFDSWDVPERAGALNAARPPDPRPTGASRPRTSRRRAEFHADNPARTESDRRRR